MRYYKFDNNGRPLASYYRNQPGVEGLIQVEEPESEYSMRSGEVWVEDVPKYQVAKSLEARTLASTRWIDSGKAVTAIQAQYDNFIDGNYSTIGEVDAAYDSFVDWLDLREIPSGEL